MGNSSSHHKKSKHYQEKNQAKKEEEDTSFKAIHNKYETLEQVQDALKDAGLESSNLILGIDYTISNDTAGIKTFNGRGLHSISHEIENPYQQVIRVVGTTLEPFDDDKQIPTYGFGDATTTSKSVFPFYPDRPCNRFHEVLQRYNEITPQIKKSGPTSFAPIIREAIQTVKRNGGAYHILIIIADGQVTPDTEWGKPESETRAAIVEASNYALSILVVGVGDGPWDMMDEFDDQLPERKFDNFQFVDFYQTVSTSPEQFRDANFSLAALMEIPTQYKLIKKLGLLGKAY